MTEYASFRQRLDAVLCTRNVRQVRAFLIEEAQWSLDAPSDPEFAMWLMIAGTPTLKDLHAEAREWLIQHGHAAEADAVLNRDQGGGKQQGAGTRKARPKKSRGGVGKPPAR